MKRSVFFLSFFFACASLFSTEYHPWYGDFLLPEFRASYALQTYPSIDTGKGDVDYSSNNHLMNLSLAFVPRPHFSLEAELLTASTKQNSPGVTHGKVTGRYLLLDDLACDPVSLSVGVSAVFPLSRFKGDFGFPYQGSAQLDLHAAVGKEWSCGPYWTYRTWLLALFGLSENGEGKLGIDYYFEKNHSDQWRWSIFMRSLLGLGDHSIDPSLLTHRSYADKAFESVEVGFSITKVIECSYHLSFEYFHRVHAHAFPEKLHAVSLNFYLPFRYF